MIFVFPEEIFQVALPESDEVVEALHLGTLNKSFQKSFKFGDRTGSFFTLIPRS